MQNTRYKIQNTGQSLLALLLIIAFAAMILGLGSQFIAIRIRTNEAAGERTINSRLVQESLETARVIARENWHNIDARISETENYYPEYSTWQYRKALTIDHTKVPSNQTNFPVLINLSTDADLAAKAQDNGADFLFTDSEGNELDYELEKFDGSTGELVTWIKVPLLSSTSSTVIYMYYGNSSDFYDTLQNPTGVWDINYVTVQHLKEDSLDFNGTDDFVDFGDVGTAKTLEFWINPNTTTESILEELDDTGVSILSGTMTYPSWNNCYVDGIDTDTITTGWHHVVLTSTANVTMSAFRLGLLVTTYFTGGIDEVRAYNRALSAKEIEDSYNNKPVSREGLIAEYLMNEGSGDTIKDTSGNSNDGDMTGHAADWIVGRTDDSTRYGNNGTASVSATGKNGKINSGQEFDGINDYVDFGDVGTAKTLEFWINPNTTTESILEELDDTGVSILSGTMTYPSWNNCYVDGIDTDTITTGWHHVVLTSTANVTMSAFRLGLLVTTYFTGNIDEARVSKTARSTDWITTNFNNQSSPSTFYTLGSEDSTSSISKWILISGIEEISLGKNTCQRKFIFHKVSRDANGDIESVYDANNDDPSTCKVTAYATDVVSGREVSIDYYLTRWQNEAVLQESWTGGRGEEGPVADFSDNKYYDSSGVTATVEGWLKLRTDWYDSNWEYRQRITVDPTKVLADFSDFPVLITEANIASDIFSNAKDAGADIRFTINDGRTEISREIELFDKVNSKLAIWVKVDLSSTLDTVLYIYYGNSSATEPPAAGEFGAENTWDGNYKGIWHLEEEVTDEGTEVNAHTDSTSNSNHGDQSGNDDITGQIANGQDFDGTNDYIGMGNVGTAKTLEFWINPNTTIESVLEELDDTGVSIILSGTMNYPSWDNCYVDGVDTDTITTGWHYVVLTSTTNVTMSAFRLGLLVTTYFTGSIDEVRVSDTARSANWITTGFNNQNSPSTFYGVEAEEKY